MFLLHAPGVEGIEESREGGIIMQASFEGRAGGFMATEFVTNDAAMGIDREIHGHPMKFADVEYTEGDDTIRGSVARHEEKLFSLSFEQTPTTFSVPDFTPQFHDRKIPSATGEGYDLNQVRVMELSVPPYVSGLSVSETDDVHRLDTGTESVVFADAASSPFESLDPNLSLVLNSSSATSNSGLQSWLTTSPDGAFQD